MEKTHKSQLSLAFSLSILMTLAMLLIGWQANTQKTLLLAVPFSLLAFLLYFSIGSVSIAERIRLWCDGRLLRFLTLPLILVAVLFFYIVLTEGNPWRGNSWQIPLLFCAPVLFYHWAIGRGEIITWKDGVGILLCLLPYVLHDYPFSSDLPIAGEGVANLYLTLSVIIAVYSLVVVRELPRVGFEPDISFDAAKLVLKWWLMFFALALAIGVPGDLLKWTGYEPLTPAVFVSGLALFLRTFFGTALPEELFFRGVMMNLLLQRIQQTGNGQRYLMWSLALIPFAALAGYTIDDEAQWFPLLCAVVVWGAAFMLSRRAAQQSYVYTSILITSLLFGLAHYHIHSNLFMGLAMVAGWVYGYVYHKTGNVFSAALTHTLVNVGPSLFGLTLIR